MAAFFPALIAFLEQSKYVLIFAGSFLEGSGVMMATGLLWHIGVVTFWLAFGALMLGDILADIMWYFVGRFAARSAITRWGHVFGLTSTTLDKVEKRFHNHHTKILIASKLTMGLGLAVPVLVTAGILRVPFRRYITINILGGIVWVFFLMCIGYYFGNVLQYIPKDFRIALIVALPVAFILLVHTASKKLSAIDW